MELDKIIPTDGPNINEVEKYINKYQSEVIVIKCGGSVLLDKKLFNQFIEDISVINKIGLSAIVVHGGGKNIKKKLDENNIISKDIRIKLLCYPRIFGYVFNPLSVFFIYDINNKLIAILYEVKNTFGEQHTYIFNKKEKVTLKKSQQIWVNKKNLEK